MSLKVEMRLNRMRGMTAVAATSGARVYVDPFSIACLASARSASGRGMVMML
jgi:hypothetical protein